MRKSTNIADISGSFDRGMTKYIPLDRSNPDEEFGAYLRYLECKGADICKIPCSFSVRNMRKSTNIADISGSFDRGIAKYIPLDRSNPDEEFGTYLRYLECKGAEIFKFP